MSCTGIFGEWLAKIGYSPEQWNRLSSQAKLDLREAWQRGATPKNAIFANKPSSPFWSNEDVGRSKL